MSADLLVHLLAATVAASAAAGMILVLRLPVRRGFGAQAAYRLWALLPLATIATLLPAPIAPPPVTLSITASVATAPAALTPTVASADLATWLLFAWLAGVGASALWFAWQQRRFVRRLGRLSQDADGRWRAERAATGPALIGAIRPRIVLPPDFERRYSAGERDLVIAHEEMHRARGDAQANALAAAVRVMFWFNPLMHLAVSRFRLDQELACDAAVLARFPGTRRRYADAMLKTQLAAQSLPVGCHWPTGHPLKERIAMLGIPLPGRARRVAGFALALVLGLGCVYAAWAAQPARPVPATNAGTVQVVDVRLRVAMDGKAPKDIRLVAPVAKPFWVTGDGVGAWKARFVAHPRSDGNIRLDMDLRQSGQVLDQPSMVLEPGRTGSVTITATDGRQRFRIDATLALHEAGWQPPVPPMPSPVPMPSAPATAPTPEPPTAPAIPPVPPAPAVPATPAALATPAVPAAPAVPAIPAVPPTPTVIAPPAHTATGPSHRLPDAVG
ncbi:MAG TPA: M56 family metallopeptidase [Rhodanobacteraceae bacterium]|nr:M56 family metallopeptidase [Rhodanobacteraceae bacterium]